MRYLTQSNRVSSVAVSLDRITPALLLLKIKFALLFAIILLYNLATTCYAQTITNVYPTRVTAGVTVTIEGTGFTNATRNSISFVDGGMNVQNRVVTPDGTRMFFDIGRNNVTTDTPASADASEDISRILQVEINGSLTPFPQYTVDYIAPTAMIHAVSSAPSEVIDGRIVAPNRVEEIYTDYGGIKTYQDGDSFTRGSDINSTTFGRWEFFGLEFPANPSGILVETGGRGRGMFIGFNSSGDFVARGGDGRTLNPANGCARLVLPASNFANTTGGRMLVTMDPRNGSGLLTFEWDADDDGVPEISTSVTAGGAYMGYNSFREWSGGNAGFVGKSNGNIAGSEIGGTADFNGVIGYMTFSNFENTPIAWRSSWGTYTNQPANERPTNPVIPDNYHDLLGFKYNGIVYATGANNDLLELFLGSEIMEADGVTPKSNYNRSRFKAYSTYGVQNTTVRQHHIFTGEFVDGKELEGPTEFRSPPNIDPNDPDYEPAFAQIRGLNMFDVLIDGKNGLNIGSGINNLNQSTSIQFFSGNGQFGGASDDVPDLLIPNMAEAGGTDVYYYTDDLGNIVGRPISIRINNSDVHNPPLSHWQNDQYRVIYPGTPFDQAFPIERIYGNAQERPMRLIGFKLQDFGISEGVDPDWGLSSIESINAGAGGTADIPFLAYNGETFQIRSPIVLTRPKARSICAVPSNIDVTFTVEASVDGGFTGDANEELNFQWFQYNNDLNQDQTGGTTSSITINNVTVSELGLYRVRISNGYGTTIVTVPIEEGGTPAIWDGTQWRFPSGYIAQGESNPGGLLTEVADEDRRLIWQQSYDIDGSEVKGCDCVIPAGSIVTISNRGALNLYGDLTLGPEEPILDIEGNPTGATRDAGQLIIENNSSLIQIEDTDVNNNEGEIVIDRVANNMSNLDFIYWASPVDGFDIDNIPNSASYLWDVRALNANGTDGNWAAYNGTMTAGKGYIARVPNNGSNFDLEATFSGKPNNGSVTLGVIKSVGSQTLENKHWNLVGNPYPSAISAEKFLLHNTNLEGAVYIWQSNASTISTSNPSNYYDDLLSYSNAYITTNVLGSVPNVVGGFDGNIASGQGFFVKVLNSTNDTDVEFRNPMRYNVAQSGLPNDDFERNGNFETTQIDNQEKQLLWLFLENEAQQSSVTLVGYADGATNGKDRLYDAFTNVGSGELSLHTIVDDINLVIQGRALPFDDQDVVPMGIQIPETGIYHIGIDQIKGGTFLDAATNIILEDTYTGVFHDLKSNPYAFNSESGDFNDRFILRYNANQLSTKEIEAQNTFAFIKDNSLTVQSGALIDQVRVYDITGKRIIDLKPNSTTKKINTNFNYSRGAYIAVITLEGNITTSIKLIN